MFKNLRSALLSGCIGILLSFQTVNSGKAQSLYVDGFEGQNINSFWKPVTISGFISLSSEQVHSGNQSVKFTSTNTGLDKWIHLDHMFDTPVYGRTSVWAYDSGADRISSNYIYFQVWNSHSANDVLALGTYDYDLGPGQNGSVYYYQPDGQHSLPTAIDRTGGWHEWVIDSQPDGVSLLADGTKVYSSPHGQPFDTVNLFLFGPSWRPAWETYFDDFSVTYHSASVPEPGALALLLGTAFTGMGLSLRRKR